MSTPTPRARWSTSRTEAFSDGVLAIAITLLVLELSVPEEDFDNLWLGIAEQWPSYLGYATSFLPFPTRLVAEAINDPDAERAAVVFYGAVLLVISLVVGAMWRVVARDPSLLEAEVDPGEVQRIARRPRLPRHRRRAR